jgi:gamma-glutamyltranspeptidase/glutathione hydrolase
MVAASQPQAAAAGIRILDRGGNAADAAVCVAAALNVTEPTSTGLGGDMFALFFDARTSEVSAINGSGRAPAGLTLERLRAEGLAELPAFHPFTITVPGACAGWFDLIERFGSMDMAELLAPAILLAEEGYPVAPVTAHFWERGAGLQLKSALNGQELTINGRAPHPGEVFRNPGLARSLKKLAEGGKRVFYEGEMAEAIAAVVQQAGGCLTLEDLTEHSSTWERPLSVPYGDYRVYECAPNGQGLVALIALNLLNGLDLRSLEPLSLERLHLEIEALRLAFADGRWYVSDPQFGPQDGGGLPLAGLLSKSYADKRRKLIDQNRATLDQRRGVPAAASDTVYFSVVDGAGNACSFIGSNYMGFGTGIVPKGWGFTLQNRGHNFDLDVAHPNALAPRKRPYHTIIPAMATRQSNGSLFASFGVMGGFMQPQGHVQVFAAMADSGLNPQEALDLPRFCIEDGRAGGDVALEEGMPADVIEGLSKRGHGVHRVSGWDRALFGRGQIILRDPTTGVLTGGSDPRADGHALGLI